MLEDNPEQLRQMMNEECHALAKELDFQLPCLQWVQDIE